MFASLNGVVGLAMAAALVVIGACGALIFFTATAVDRIAEVRESELLERAIARRFARMTDDLTSATVWSEAYDHIAHRLDPAWARLNFGEYFNQYMGHDLSVVLNAQGRPVYAAVDGQDVATWQIAGFIQAAQPLAARVAALSAAKVDNNSKALGFSRVAAAHGAIRVGARVYLAAATTVVPEPGYARALLDEPDPVVISAVEVDSDVLASLNQDYGLASARLLPTSTGSVPVKHLRDVDGKPIAAIGWSPERPGREVYIEARWSIFAAALAVVLAVAILILRLRWVARELIAARDQAEAGTRAKSDFIANMSHEIRTPLNGVLGMAQAMESHPLIDEQRERLTVIRKSGEVLLGVLNDVLDISKIEAGKLDISVAPFDLETLGREVCDAFEGMASGKGLSVEMSIEPEACGAWIGDTLRLRQVLSNLLSNAIKFTDVGGVTLKIDVESFGVRFEVIDTGAGIKQSQLPALFEKFVQADASSTRRHGGTGLGLPISRALVESMGGRLAASSRPGFGSVFTATLPLPRAKTTPQIETPQADLSEPEATTRIEARLRILAAEDNLTNQLVLSSLLGPLDVDVTFVVNGREAVAAFSHASFDVILMDIQMPELSGDAATRAIRSLEAERGLARTPILALSANVMTDQVADYLAAGMDGFVAKPLGAAALYEALQQATTEPATSVAA